MIQKMSKLKHQLWIQSPLCQCQRCYTTFFTALNKIERHAATAQKHPSCSLLPAGQGDRETSTNPPEDIASTSSDYKHIWKSQQKISWGTTLKTKNSSKSSADETWLQRSEHTSMFCLCEGIKTADPKISSSQSGAAACWVLTFITSTWCPTAGAFTGLTESKRYTKTFGKWEICFTKDNFKLCRGFNMPKTWRQLNGFYVNLFQNVKNLIDLSNFQIESQQLVGKKPQKPEYSYMKQ